MFNRARLEEPGSVNSGRRGRGGLDKLVRGDNGMIREGSYVCLGEGGEVLRGSEVSLHC